jgi:hypothetical protein
MVRCLVAALVLLVPAAGIASPEPMVFPTVGFGLGLDLPSATLAEHVDYGRDPTTVFIEAPLVLGRLRLAPELGFGMGTSSSELRWFTGDDLPAGWVRGDRIEEQRLVLGVNVGPAFRFSPEMRGWVGGRAAVSARHTEFGDRRPDHLGFDFSVGAVVGGETFLLDRFSLGGEARLSFTSVDGALVAPRDSGSARLRRGWSLGFDVLAAVRFYFR